MPSLLIRGGRVIDPSQELDRETNVFIKDGRIAGIGVDENAIANEDPEVIDATDRVVTPGLIDMHVELREPGCEEDETIETGAAAALAGGFTSIVCTPNTDPPLDSQAAVQFIQQKAARADRCNVWIIGCVSKNREGKELAELGGLSDAGVVGFSDADRPIHNSELLRRALEYCLMFDKPILNHPEDLELSHGGIMHEGRVSMILGLAGMPADAEDVMISRDLRLAESTGGRFHLMNISSAVGVELIRRSKARGIEVSAEITAAHFLLTDENLRTFDANFKINPPLRSRHHVEACIAGLADGTLDVICSGHSPRADEKKMRELDQAPFGMSSLETTLALVITHLIEPGHLDWPRAVAKMTTNPARILGIDRGTLRPDAVADVTVIDPHCQWTVNPARFCSKSRSTPFAGAALQGRAERVIVAGRQKYVWTGH